MGKIREWMDLYKKKREREREMVAMYTKKRNIRERRDGL
jgi:hypothetical protein